MVKEDLLLIGAGGHAKACIDVIENQDRFRIIGLIGTIEEYGKSILGYEILGTDSELPKIRNRVKNAFIVVGQIKNNRIRKEIYDNLKSLRYELPTIFASSSYISKYAKIGEGSILMHQSVVNSGATIGVNSIINTRALVEHDCVVGNHCHIATASVLNGGVRLGDQAFIGSGAIVREGIQIGKGCLIGMGLKVLKDLPNDTVFIR